MEASRSSLPNEFGAFLRAEYGVIYEIAMLPGTIQGQAHAMFWMYNKPIDFEMVGSVHSHPSGVTRPSDEDLHMFSDTGDIHIITGYPYRMTDFTAYNRRGEKVDLKVLQAGSIIPSDKK